MLEGLQYGDVIFCKKDFINPPRSENSTYQQNLYSNTLALKKGKWYLVKFSPLGNPFVIDENCVYRLLRYDFEYGQYFYTKKELRLAKLEKLKNK